MIRLEKEKQEVQERDSRQEVEVIGEEFSIIELEDRLELAGRCNTNCSCPAP